MVRTWRSHLQQKYGVIIELMHPILAWMTRHAAWVHDRFHVSVEDRLTAYERQFEKRYNKKLIAFGETVMWRRHGSNIAKFATPWGVRHLLGPLHGERRTHLGDASGHNHCGLREEAHD